MGVRSKNTLSLFLLLSLVALAAWAATGEDADKYNEPGAPAAEQEHAPAVLNAPAASSFIVREATKRVELRGYTRAADSITLTTEVGGRIKAVNYEVGQAVLNAPFIEIDTTFIDLTIESTSRQLERLAATEKRAASHVKYLSKEFKRIKSLHKQGRTSESKYDASVQQLAQARLELSSVSAEHGALKVTLRELREKRRRHMVGPQKGWVITGRLVEPGEVVAPGQPLGKASDFTSLVVPLSVSLREYEALAAIENTIEARLEGRRVEASLNWQNPDFDERTRKSAVEIAIVNTAGLAPRGGLSLMLPLMVRTEGLLVPRKAVSWRYQNPRVVLSATGEIVPLIVTDESGEGLVVADDGRLKAGDELLPANQPAKQN
jgi:multidrug efflux pump subunit AcrA (membrane-fusion protein)